MRHKSLQVASKEQCLDEGGRVGLCRMTSSLKRRTLLTVAVLFLTALLLASARGCRDSFDYAIYAIPTGSKPDLLAQGTAKADGTNVKSAEGAAFGRHFQRKWIELESDFIVGANVYREKRLDGFGLWIRRHGSGFSWNWFTRESGLVFRKLQGSGRIEASLTPNKEYEELSGVEFLDDVTLTGQFGWLPYWDTHQVIIKKGSVLRLSP